MDKLLKRHELPNLTNKRDKVNSPMSTNLKPSKNTRRKSKTHIEKKERDRQREREEKKVQVHIFSLVNSTKYLKKK